MMDHPSLPHSPIKASGGPPKPARAGSGLTRARFNLLLDTTLLVVFIAVCWVAVVIRFVFPVSASAAGWTLWQFGLDDWISLEFNLVAAFALLVLLHVMLHWNWVCGVTAEWLSRRRGQRVKPDEGLRTIYGVGLLIAIVNLLGLLTAAAVLSIQSPPL